MFLSYLMALIVDTSIPIQSKSPNLYGGGSIDLVDQFPTANNNYGLVRVRGYVNNGSGYTVKTLPVFGDGQPNTFGSEIKGIADFDGNGVGDFVIRNRVTGANSIWLLKRVQSSSSVFFDSVYNLPNTYSGWDIKGVADFDGDGKQNILWQNTDNGETSIWGINYNAGNPASTRFTIDTNKTKNLTTTPTTWSMVGWADMNNDGVRDILWQEPSTGNTAIWELTSNVTVANSYLGQNVGANSGWKIEGVSDFDSNGINDVVWRNDGSNDTAIWKMKRVNNQTVIDQSYLLAFKPGSSDWQITSVTDMNNDGVPDFTWSNYTSKENAVWELKMTNGVPSFNRGFITDTALNNGVLDDNPWRFRAIARP
jgi:hypothetical protein